jgi:hypothetical protein
MSKNWNELREGAERVIDKISAEAVRLGDAASMKLKLEACRGRLNNEYALLGKLTYAKLNGGKDNAEQIDAAIKRITDLRLAEKEILRDIEEAKAEKEAAKEAEKSLGNK